MGGTIFKKRMKRRLIFKMPCKKVKIKQPVKPVKECLSKRIVKTLPKDPIRFPKPAKKPVIKKVC
jgi:hypothetical protein